jgi:hypothetical protein
MPHLNGILGGSRDINIKIASRNFNAKTHPASQHGNAYLYSFLNYPTWITWILGMSYDDLDEDILGEFGQVNPKFGLIWNITQETTLRLAAFRTLTRSLLNEQTIEPTQVAGFNQFFDDTSATESRRIRIALDQKFLSTLYGGIEASKRDLKVSFTRSFIDDWEEQLYRAYFN